jgi:hypothetical protein
LPVLWITHSSLRRGLVDCPDELQSRVDSIFRLNAPNTLPIGQIPVGTGLCLLSLRAMLIPHMQHASSSRQPAAP